VACHGPGGRSTNPLTPSIAGQQPIYVFLQLVQFRERRRVNPLMAPIATGLSDADMENLAAYFATERPAPPPATAEPAIVEAGRRVTAAYRCEVCHAAGFAGQQHVPRLSGLGYEYLKATLLGFKAQTRADIDGAMTEATRPLSDEQIEAVARYLATL
jgi:cytochrome c553